MTAASEEIAALAKGGRTNIMGFALRLLARLPFLFVAGRFYGPEIVGRFAVAVLVVEFAALVATLGLKRGLAQALSTTSRPHTHVVWDALIVALIASMIASGLLILFPQAMYPNSQVIGFERLLPFVVFAVACTDIALAALAYRHNVKATVTARAIVEPWTISIAAFALYYVSARDGLILSYVLATLATLVAALAPFLKSYGLPQGWVPHPTPMFALARRNMPLAGADTIEWATRNVDRFILGLLFGPAVVGVYYMAQQVASLPQKLKTSFDPVLGPVVTQALKRGDRAAVAAQIRQVGFWIMAAQAALALIGSIPAEGVMGVIGPQFVVGAGALCFLLWAEVLASPGAVAESGLVYVARHRNLMISVLILSIQVALSFALVALMRRMGWPEAWQAAGPAVALAFTLALGSAIKGWLLARLLSAPVSPLRWPFAWAVLATSLAGSAMTQLPEWAELAVGIPVMLVIYFSIIWRFAFGPRDRALFSKLPHNEAPTLPLDERV